MRALTLVEVLIVIVILGVLAGLAVPSLLTFMQLNKVNAITRELISTLNYAKSEAIKQTTSISICPRDPTDATNTTCSTNWAAGWIVFSGTALSSGARLTVNDRDLSTEMTLTATTLTATVASITFDNTGFPGNDITFTLLPTNCRSNNERIVRLSAAGRVSVSEEVCPP
jgi:type IV fimbrial biogenesis protein FimT